MDAKRGGKGEARLEQALNAISESLSKPSPDRPQSARAASMPDFFARPVMSPIANSLGWPAPARANAVVDPGGLDARQSPERSRPFQAPGIGRQHTSPIPMTDIRIRRMGESEAWNHMSRLIREGT